MSAHALMAWTRSQRDRMTRAFDPTLETWAHEWMLADGYGSPQLSVGEFRSANRLPSPRAGAQWTRLAHSGDAMLWLRHDAGALDSAIEQLVFGTAPPPNRNNTMAARIAAHARADLLQSLAARSGLALASDRHDDAPPDDLLRRWSGAVVAELALAGCTVTLLMNAACAARLAGEAHRPAKATSAAPTLTPLREALAGNGVRVRAELQAMDIQIGTLLGMARGDVIRLTHRLDEPLILSTAAQHDFCAGHLVQVEGRLAVELATRGSSARDE